MKIALSALRRKHATLLGEIEAAERALTSLRAQLGLIDATMRIFDPDADLASIRAIKTLHRCRWFRHGEQLRLVVTALREADAPQNTTQIARFLMAAKQLPDDISVVNPMRRQARIALQRLEKKGLVRRVVVAPDLWWELAGPE